MRSKIMAAIPLMLASACAFNPATVPVLGAVPDVLELAGQWSGEYWSLDSGRSGSIVFRLEAGADSAIGDVLMIPTGRWHDHPDGRHPTSEYLSIAFVRVSGGRVRGVLEPYRDPSCGCLLDTSFEGELRGDAIDGTFSSRHVETRARQEGRWRVRRTRTVDS
jgi:hypothetical protein